ncbi:hypothetical protein SAMN05421824_1517 [Hyunsoonleella jejuensis]|uniref:Uncharacterized protein n=1 Tax=Hyunsoonleella jejuensis TaxID=419940 RepID=A0A1H9FNM4_9FLAO|nr:hypothetical protein [Hyunsoonleella jejuensis]SEQ38948.1 hypothetical protein SAMN05421824_1517 [Hyunsoonleella jejuensis]
MKFEYALGMLFLLFQVGSVVYARLVPQWYFCWAQYDEHTNYAISLKINGELLSKEDITNRYDTGYHNLVGYMFFLPMLWKNEKIKD